MITQLRDHGAQVVLVTLQSFVVLYGFLATGTMMKAVGYPEFDNFGWLLLAVRRAGWMLLLVPPLWAWVTLHFEASSAKFSRRWTVLTGAGLLWAFWWFFSNTMKAAALTPGPLQGVE